MGGNEFANLIVQRVSPAFRRGYWTRNRDELDAAVLWPGLRQELVQWLACESPIVIAALAGSGEAFVASRSVFSRSQTLRDLWYYGYFYTLPNFRRLGLGERVLREGLAEIGKAGARYCSCYVADDNRASADLAIKLGFRRLPFVRVVFSGAEDAAVLAVLQGPAETGDVRMLAGAMDLIGRVTGGAEGAAIITDELFVRHPWQPWKTADSRLVRLGHEKIGIGIGRIGPYKAVLLPDPDVLVGDSVEMLLSAVSAMRGDMKRPVFSFVPLRIAECLRKSRHKASCEIFDVFWHDEVRRLDC